MQFERWRNGNGIVIVRRRRPSSVVVRPRLCHQSRPRPPQPRPPCLWSQQGYCCAANYDLNLGFRTGNNNYPCGHLNRLLWDTETDYFSFVFATKQTFKMRMYTRCSSSGGAMAMASSSFVVVVRRRSSYVLMAPLWHHGTIAQGPSKRIKT